MRCLNGQRMFCIFLIAFGKDSYTTACMERKNKKEAPPEGASSCSVRFYSNAWHRTVQEMP